MSVVKIVYSGRKLQTIVHPGMMPWSNRGWPDSKIRQKEAFTGDLAAKWHEVHIKELPSELEGQAKALEVNR